MGYSTITDIQNIMAQALTSATSSTAEGLSSTFSLLNVGNVLDKNLTTFDIIDSYIQIADSEIDAELSLLYETPMRELANFEGTLFSAIDEYNPYIVVNKTSPLTPGDIVILKDGVTEERHEIEEVIDASMFSTVNNIDYNFPVDSRVIRVSYPHPIKFISSRRAAANIYDKYFSSESSPNISTFGNQLREIAINHINSVLNGTIILHGQHRIGRRFYNPTLTDQYAAPSGGTISDTRKQVK